MQGTNNDFHIVEPFMPHEQEYYLNIVSERLGSSISFSECGGMEIEENWDKVKTIFLPSDKSLSLDTCAPIVATLPLEVRAKIANFIQGTFAVFQGRLPLRLWCLCIITFLYQ